LWYLEGMKRSTVLLASGSAATVAIVAIMAIGAAATPFHVLRCVPYPLGNYKDPECREPVLDGQYKRVAITEGTSFPLSGVQATDYVLKSTVLGLGVTVTCKKAATSGTMENPEGGGSTVFEGVVTAFSECTIGAGSGCQVKGGSVTTNNLAGSVVSGPAIELVPESGEVIAGITVEKCTLSGLNKTYKLTGSLVAAVNNSASSIEFTTTSGSSLTLDGASATLTGTSEVASEEYALFVE
jgi:hypothetical protein